MKIGIFSNEIKDRDNKEAVKLSELLRFRGIEVFLFTNSDRTNLDSIISKTQIELLIVFGGDGTMLGVVAAASRNNVPIIGINMGHIGFLSEIEHGEDFDNIIDEYSKGNYQIDERTFLEINDSEKSYLALNEVLMVRNEDCCVISIDVMIEDNFLDRYVGDGVLVCTPTGSTAYSLSAGGPILSPDIEAFVINPVCPHSLHNRPIVISDKHTVRLKLMSERIKAKVILDGKVIAIIDNREEVVVAKSNIKAKFIRFTNHNFYKRLLLKMNYWSSTRMIKE